MIPTSVALGIAWAAVACSASLVAMQISAFDPARAPLLPLNMILAGLFFLIAKP